MFHTLGFSSNTASVESGYRCAQCGKIHVLNPRDSVRCTRCGYCVMYKIRGNLKIPCVAR